MKLIKYITALGLAVFSANAVAISLADVGAYDNLVGQATLSKSGDGFEEAWIESVLGDDIDFTKIPLSAGDDGSWMSVSDGVAGDYALNLAPYNPEYYLVKIGGGSGAGADDTHYLFDNTSNLGWGFINLSLFGEDVKITNFSIISHVGATGSGACEGDCGEVPEPAMVGLLAIGLLGFAVARRRKNV